MNFKLMQDATLPNDNAALVETFMVRGMQSVLPIVAGESGSGKTHLLLTCDSHAFIVYVPCISACDVYQRHLRIHLRFLSLRSLSGGSPRWLLMSADQYCKAVPLPRRGNSRYT
jgi:hypothetical protein